MTILGNIPQDVTHIMKYEKSRHLKYNTETEEEVDEIIKRMNYC
jgi:hypothetical protein